MGFSFEEDKKKKRYEKSDNFEANMKFKEKIFKANINTVIAYIIIAFAHLACLFLPMFNIIFPTGEFVFFQKETLVLQTASGNQLLSLVNLGENIYSDWLSFLHFMNTMSSSKYVSLVIVGIFLIPRILPLVRKERACDEEMEKLRNFSILYKNIFLLNIGSIFSMLIVLVFFDGSLLSLIFITIDDPSKLSVLGENYLFGQLTVNGYAIIPAILLGVAFAFFVKANAQYNEIVNSLSVEI